MKGGKSLTTFRHSDSVSFAGRSRAADGIFAFEFMQLFQRTRASDIVLTRSSRTAHVFFYQ